MTFPQRNIFGQPKGWRDKGEVETKYIQVKDKISTNVTICSLCKHRASVGVEDGKSFLFCRVCESLLKKS